MSRSDLILAAAVETIVEGHVLHVRADRLPASRKKRTPAQPAVDCTVGPDANGAFLVVDYARIRSGVEDRYVTADDAIRAVRRLLTWPRVVALGSALLAVHGPAERVTSHAIEDARTIAAGARMRVAFAGRRPLVGPLFGPGFGPFGRW